MVRIRIREERKPRQAERPEPEIVSVGSAVARARALREEIQQELAELESILDEIGSGRR